MKNEEYIQKMYKTTYEFCTRCNADLIYQKGFSPSLDHWICRGCGEMLINPNSGNESDVVWICDGCGATLNTQPGFAEDCGEWTCNECGYENFIDESSVFDSEEEYLAHKANPLNGMSDEDVMKLQKYVELDFILGHENVILVRNIEDDRLYVKKILTVYDTAVYRYLMQNPVEHMPKIFEIYESKNHLFVIEEYIRGMNIEEKLEESVFDADSAVDVAIRVCSIAKELHCMGNPIIHRDIKPSNIVITEEGEVYLLDINAAKWLRENESEDTKLMGTQYYAAPEQYGFGFSASSEKTDIYAIGMLLNKMLTGAFPKEIKADEPFWGIIEKCINYEFEKRFSDDELIDALKNIHFPL